MKLFTYVGAIADAVAINLPIFLAKKAAKVALDGGTVVVNTVSKKAVELNEKAAVAIEEYRDARAIRAERVEMAKEEAEAKAKAEALARQAEEDRLNNIARQRRIAKERAARGHKSGVFGCA